MWNLMFLRFKTKKLQTFVLRLFRDDTMYILQGLTTNGGV